jgi:transcriptional regulator with PAS, ATPase and Fis domain
MPFVVVNCAAVPEALVESELFGHTRGAFTGATKARAGKLEIADSGTVFLDDIESLDVNTQAKLLRVIQEKEFGRVGSNRTIRVDVRFIAASNKNIKALLETGALREDLFYRLNVFPVVLPPLRERHRDVPLLLDHFMKLHTRATGQEAKTFTTRAKQVLSRYPWPGNVRELENLVERLFTVVRSETIRVRDLPPFQLEHVYPEGVTLKDAVRIFEKQYIGDILERVNGNRIQAARLLGIHRNTLLAKINDLEV